MLGLKIATFWLLQIVSKMQRVKYKKTQWIKSTKPLTVVGPLVQFFGASVASESFCKVTSTVSRLICHINVSTQFFFLRRGGGGVKYVLLAIKMRIHSFIPILCLQML